MMTNLFSIFDPSTNIMGLSLNWLSILLTLLFLQVNFWLTPNRIMIFNLKIYHTLFKEFKMLMNNYMHQGHYLIFLTLFMFIFINNFMGLFPYIFTATTHMSLTLTLSLTIWLTLMIYGWANNYTHMMAHLIPNSTPLLLTWFMVLIELTSNLIRPITLAVRLMANMTAGHLLITLLTEMNNKMSLFLVFFILMAQILLLILELSVSIIQSYVFFILSSLYTMEI